MLQRFANGSLSPDEIFFHMGSRASRQSYQHTKSSKLSQLVIRHGQVVQNVASITAIVCFKTTIGPQRYSRMSRVCSSRPFQSMRLRAFAVAGSITAFCSPWKRLSGVSYVRRWKDPVKFPQRREHREWMILFFRNDRHDRNCIIRNDRLEFERRRFCVGEVDDDKGAHAGEE